VSEIRLYMDEDAMERSLLAALRGSRIDARFIASR
jgi:hypothetical protein